MKGIQMYAIAITEATLDLIEELNNGVRPKIQKELTFFVWKKDEPAEIVTKKDLKGISDQWTMAAHLMHLVK
jgi:hypothetical protein